ncbi:hypothetical protein [Aurantiacibacter suaedae]|uniref:hypothetical protein n=1 Tax=Aurantiacibacter suaedae TaxID=2545755 RepID=UPI0010F6A6EB|nr:hypothetical protein [Aurantiacibacter suaedae]
MTLKDYLLGRRFELVSALPREEIARRISTATPSMLSPLARGVAGSCRFGRLRLFWRIPFFDNGFAPVFAGRLTSDRRQTRISARWGASLYVRVFFTIWYGLVLVIAISLATALFGGRPSAGNDLLIVPFVGLFALVPLLVHLVFNRSADKHLTIILAFLVAEIAATEAPISGGRAARSSAPTSAH